MTIPKEDIKIERTKGKGPGGTNRNKTSSCIKLTHIPTGIQVTKDGRDQHKNLSIALKELEKRLLAHAEAKKAEQRKERRDEAIHERKIIRTYDFKNKRVKDHRTKKVAPLDQVLYRGKLDLLK